MYKGQVEEGRVTAMVYRSDEMVFRSFDEVRLGQQTNRELHRVVLVVNVAEWSIAEIEDSSGEGSAVSLTACGNLFKQNHPDHKNL